MDIGSILVFIAVVAAERLVEYALEKFVRITRRTILEWFEKLLESWLNKIKCFFGKPYLNQEDYLLVTVKIELQGRESVIVQGIFNKNIRDFAEVRVLEYESLDSQVSNAHRRQKVVIWNDPS